MIDDTGHMSIKFFLNNKIRKINSWLTKLLLLTKHCFKNIYIFFLKYTTKNITDLARDSLLQKLETINWLWEKARNILIFWWESILCPLALADYGNVTQGMKRKLFHTLGTVHFTRGQFHVKSQRKKVNSYRLLYDEN